MKLAPCLLVNDWAFRWLSLYCFHSSLHQRWFQTSTVCFIYTASKLFFRIRVVILPLIISHKFPFESDSTLLSNINSIYVFIGSLRGSGTATVDKDSSSLKLFGCKSPSKGGQLWKALKDSESIWGQQQRLSVEPTYVYFLSKLTFFFLFAAWHS